MIDQYFLSVEVFAHPRGGNVFGRPHGAERPLWQGHAGLAEYAFDQPASQPCWTLPETTQVMVTDQRVLYAHTRSDSPDTREVVSGELRWMSPQHLRVQPGEARAGRSAATTQIQLVCAGSDGTWPALVFAGGDLRTVAEADRLANLIRQAIARFRLDNAAKLGLSTQQSRLLSRLVIGPEFANYQGGPGQTVSILGALPVTRPAAAPTAAPEPVAPARTRKAAHRLSEAPTVDLKAFRPISERPTSERPANERPANERPANERLTSERPVSERPVSERPVNRGPGSRGPVGEGPTRVITVRPGLAADLARAQQAAEAETTAQQDEPEMASRAAEVAARVADLIRPARPASAPPASPRHAEHPSATDRFEATTNLTQRAEVMRRTAARLAANSARHKASARPAARGVGAKSYDGSP
jgi:hypothetical protein